MKLAIQIYRFAFVVDFGMILSPAVEIFDGACGCGYTRIWFVIVEAKGKHCP